MIRKWENAALSITLALGACRGTPPVTMVPPPAPPVYADWQQRLGQQNADAVIYQHTSAEIFRLYEQCYELARIRLDVNLAHAHTLPAAVIVDIDETVLDNSSYQVKNAAMGRTYTPETWREWALMGSAKALPGSLAFLRYSSEKGCTIHYITNRSEEEKNATVKNLHELGFPNADDAHVWCMEGTDTNKFKRREKVAASHFVALLVGDQLRDFHEDFKDRTLDHGRDRVMAMRDTLRDWFILLPNPMYGTWMDPVAGKVDSLKAGRKELFFKQHSY